MSSNNILYQKALEYAARGYSVIPLKKDKRPLLAQNIVYQRERPPTDDEITDWWDTTPTANVGVCTGRISGLTVVDIDTSGDTSVPLDTFPPTYTVLTPTGGYHLYYEYDEEIKQTANTYAQFPHVDIRNDGGYVVAPPSHCIYDKGGKSYGGTYTVFRALPVSPFPKQLFIQKTSRLSRQKRASLLKNFPKMSDGDGRNNALTAVVGRIIGMVPPQDYESEAWPVTLAANSQFAKPLSEREVRTRFDSISGRQMKKPLATVEFLRNDKGIIPNEENVYRTIKADPVLINYFRYNVFTGVLESLFENTEWEALQRVDVISVRMHLMRTYPHFARIAHSTVEDSIIRYCKENKVSPPVEYFKGLLWDKTPRLDTWISQTYNVKDNEYHRAVASNWLKGMVKRLVEPGCKFDYVLVLEGKQGIKKSTSLAILGGRWHVETTMSTDSKDFFMQFSGKSIIEFSEGETLNRTEVKRMKAIITMQFDKYRPPYERSAKDFPRQCVFAMTTNQEEYLKDETGNRRWLPIACEGQVNTEWLTQNRDQLFAEAYHRVTVLNETLYEFPEGATREEQEKRQITDPREAQIADWYYNILGETERTTGITTRMAYEKAILKGTPTNFSREMNKMDEMVIGGILSGRLGLKRERVMNENIRMYRYFPTPQSEAVLNKTEISADEIWNKFPQTQ